MFYIHDSVCISPQETYFSDQVFRLALDELNGPLDKKMKAVEPVYKHIPPGALRRMGRSVRLGIGAALPVVQKNKEKLNGFILGTAMGGMEDCVKFLNQIIEYNEGQLTPTNFVQSTPNAVAGQLGLLTHNNGYNITHVHRGLSFENALIDADMQLSEHPGHSFLLGAVEEISDFHYNIERLDGWYKNEERTQKDWYASHTPGSIAGEGASMFIVNDQQRGAKACLSAIHIFQSNEEKSVQEQFKTFIEKYELSKNGVDLFLTGENGDVRFDHLYEMAEKRLPDACTVARFKHISGEHPTASALAVWLAAEIISKQQVPAHIIKSGAAPHTTRRILLYNHYKGVQHSFMLIEHP